MNDTSPTTPVRSSDKRKNSAAANTLGSPGYTFGKSKRVDDTVMRKASSTPGPIYDGHEVHNNIISKNVSIPKGKRTSILDMITSVSPGPAANYNAQLPGRAKSPCFSIGKSKRFLDSELKQKETKLTPGPGSYAPIVSEGTISNDAPAFSFGSRGNDRRYFSDELDFRGPTSESPGPIYDVTTPLKKLSDSPSITIPKGPKPFPFSIFPVMNDQKPSPADHNIPSTIAKETPSYSFGTSTRDVQIIRNNDFAVNMNGVDSPGPKYNIDDLKAFDRPPGAVFYREDRERVQTHKRFISHKLSLSENYGKLTPGPAAYSPEKVSDTSPSYTMGHKEREITDTVYPQSRRPRFLSKELAAENFGQWSPGPKYNYTSTLSGPKYSFAVSDELTRTKQNAPRNNERLYNGFGFRTVFHENPEVSPGPKYEIKSDLGNGPAFSMPKSGLREKTSERSSKKHVEDPKKMSPGPAAYNPDLSKIGRISVSPDFNSMGKAPSKKAGRLKFQSTGKDSPGPGVYTVDFTKLSSSPGKRSASMGGLC